jgi:hypothetical protein
MMTPYFDPGYLWLVGMVVIGMVVIGVIAWRKR